MKNFIDTKHHHDIFFEKDVQVKQSVIESKCQLYRAVQIDDSVLKSKNIIGDFSRIRSSKLGEMVRIDRSNFIFHSNIGDYSYTGANDVIMHSEIGRFCSISWGVTIGPGEHDYKRITSHDFLYNDFYGIKNKEEKESYNRFKKQCTIGNDVWIGTNATILRGVKIGDGAVIGANSIITKDIPPYAIAVGNPAKIVRFRFDDSVIKELLNLKWWDFSYEKIKRNFLSFNNLDIESVIKELKQK